MLYCYYAISMYKNENQNQSRQFSLPELEINAKLKNTLYISLFA